MNEIQKKLEDNPSLESNPEKALKETFIDVDNTLRKDASIDAELSGTPWCASSCSRRQGWSSTRPTRATRARPSGRKHPRMKHHN